MGHLGAAFFWDWIKLLRTDTTKAWEWQQKRFWFSGFAISRAESLRLSVRRLEKRGFASGGVAAIKVAGITESRQSRVRLTQKREAAKPRTTHTEKQGFADELLVRYGDLGTTERVFQ